jgi:4-amino-4-deoxy-L-arabinose transferase-like glycosyltransferase
MPFTLSRLVDFLKRGNHEKIILATILLLAFLLRIWTINYDLPFIYHPDEPRYITISQNIFKTGDLNPHFFNFPSLFLYINASSYIPYYFIGRIMGRFGAPVDIQVPISIIGSVTKTLSPSSVLLGRLVTVCFSVASIWVTFLIGGRLSNKRPIGVLAAFFLAVSPIHTAHGRYITPDTFVSFFAAASLYYSIIVYQEGKCHQYLLAGLFVGLTTSTKYNGALVILPLFLAHILRHGKRFWRDKKIYYAVLALVCGFFITTPYSVIDFPSFLEGARFEANHYSSGHPGMDGDSLLFYLRLMWPSGNIMYIAALAEIIRGLITRSKQTLILAIFPIIYFSFISSLTVRNDRTFLPLMPFLFLLVASFIAEMYTLFAQPRLRYARIAFVGILIVATAAPMINTVTDTIALTREDARETARIWINANLPKGSVIAVETYSPYLEADQFEVSGFQKIIVNKPDWYIQKGYQYLVFSNLTYQRFFDEPDRYQKEIALYNGLFAKFNLIREFESPLCKILVYAVQPNIP